MSTLPKTLDAGDGLTFDRDLALKATRHVLIATKLLNMMPELCSLMDVEMVERHISEMLGGDHWRPIARQLVNEVIAEVIAGEDS